MAAAIPRHDTTSHDTFLRLSDGICPCRTLPLRRPRRRPRADRWRTTGPFPIYGAGLRVLCTNSSPRTRPSPPAPHRWRGATASGRTPATGTGGSPAPGVASDVETTTHAADQAPKDEDLLGSEAPTATASTTAASSLGSTARGESALPCPRPRGNREQARDPVRARRWMAFRDSQLRDDGRRGGGTARNSSHNGRDPDAHTASVCRSTTCSRCCLANVTAGPVTRPFVTITATSAPCTCRAVPLST